eukprot:723708-Pyramimonas_sp.AAC.1
MHIEVVPLLEVCRSCGLTLPRKHDQSNNPLRIHARRRPIGAVSDVTLALEGLGGLNARGCLERNARAWNVRHAREEGPGAPLAPSRAHRLNADDSLGPWDISLMRVHL